MSCCALVTFRILALGLLIFSSSPALVTAAAQTSPSSVPEADKRNHWAFKTPVRPPVPSVKQGQWTRNPIDSFVLSRLEKEKLSPSAEAERQVLIRRLSLDLTGLPPTIEEVNEFLRDRRPDAYERLV